MTILKVGAGQVIMTNKCSVCGLESCLLIPCLFHVSARHSMLTGKRQSILCGCCLKRGKLNGICYSLPYADYFKNSESMLRIFVSERDD